MATVSNDARRAVVATLADAVDRRDVDGAGACLSPDVLVEVSGWGGPWHGRAAAATALGELFALCEQTRCVIRESQIDTGQINDQLIVAAKSSRSANPGWMVAAATSTSTIKDGLVTHLVVDVDSAALLSQWRGAGIAAASVRSEVALIGFDPDARVAPDVRTVEPVSLRPEPTKHRRRPMWVALVVILVTGAAVAAWAAVRGQTPADPSASSQSPVSTTTASATPTTTDPASPSVPAPLGPSAVPVAGGGVSERLSGTVLFNRDSAVLKPEARAIVVGLAGTLRATSGGSLTVLGYTDNLGSAALGARLSQARADAVAAVFRQELVGTRITITSVGRGALDPVAPNDTEANRAKNRRVEIVYRPA